MKYIVIGTASIGDVKILLKKQNLNCYICNDPLVLNWEERCCYQTRRNLN